MNIRKSVVAGQFYSDNPDKLKKVIETAINKEKKNINYNLAEKNIIGGIVPHAGYMFSSYQAIHFFEIIKNKNIDTVIIINPSHTGIGNEISVDNHDMWQTPFGNLEVDLDFASKMNIVKSSIEQSREHSSEVMLPFLQYYFRDEVKIVPITIKFPSLENSIKVSEEIYNAKNKLNRNIMIIASSDFSHYVSPEYGKKIDHLAVDKILKFDTIGFNNIVLNENISICGFGPIMALINYSKLESKNPKAEILKFGSSGDIIPSSEVVDYFSILFYSLL